MSEWITYERAHFKSREPVRIVRLATEPEPSSHGGLWSARPSTSEEIAQEVTKRGEDEKVRTAVRNFTMRAEYAHAVAIRDRLEFMTYENHPLDRLTLEEWAALRDKLGA